MGYFNFITRSGFHYNLSIKPNNIGPKCLFSYEANISQKSVTRWFLRWTAVPATNPQVSHM